LRSTSTPTDRRSAPALARVRLAIAAAAVLASLLAMTAWFKSATCGCGSRGLPWETIALAATVAAAVAIAAYVIVGAISRPR
jgi:hypothetical protein